MARHLAERQLTATQGGRILFDLATEADDEGIRRLLRDNPMPGRISVSLEREPNYFADAHLPDETKQAIVARKGGRVLCVGSCTIRQRFVNGQARPVGYLGGLRLDAAAAGRFDILRRGYEFFRELQATPADFYFTSVASDNDRARRVLERGLPGMPRYEFLGEFVTVLLPTKPAPSLPKDRPPLATPANQFASHFNQHNCQYQFAPCYSPDDLASLEVLGFRLEDFRSVSEAGQMLACGALWDQRCFKQTVIRGYARSLAWGRPMVNLLAPLTGWTRLPPIGATLSNGFVTWFATASEVTLTNLLLELLNLAAGRGLDLLTLGFAADDPRLTTVRNRFLCREYRSRLYLVHWKDCGGAGHELDGRLLGPEVALL